MLRLPVHTFADIGDVGEDGLLVTFTHDLWRGDGVPLASGSEEGGVRGVQLGVETVKELYVMRVRSRLGTERSGQTDTDLLVGVVTVTLQPRLIARIEACARVTSARERIIAKVALLEVLSSTLIPALVLFSLLRFRLLQLLLERLEVKRGLLRRFLLLFLEIGEVQILRSGSYDGC